MKRKILKIFHNFSSNSPDVNIHNKKVIILDYSLEKGYSGGPLFSNDNKVIGMMSMKLPSSDNQYKDKIVAISWSEFPEL